MREEKDGEGEEDGEQGKGEEEETVILKSQLHWPFCVGAKSTSNSYQYWNIAIKYLLFIK